MYTHQDSSLDLWFPVTSVCKKPIEVAAPQDKLFLLIAVTQNKRMRFLSGVVV